METITKQVVLALCEQLGHDPAQVARIIIEPRTVTVEYVHPITEKV